MFHLERKVEKKNLSEVVNSFKLLCNTTKLESPSSEASASVMAPETYRACLPVFHQLDGRRPKNLEIWNEDLGRNLRVWQSGPWCFWLFFGESPTVLRVPLGVKLRVFSGSLLHHWGWGSCGFKAESCNIRKPWLRDSLYGRSSPQLWTLQVHLL